jgi:hypothetical protein
MSKHFLQVRHMGSMNIPKRSLRWSALLSVGFLLLVSAQSASADDALKFFKNYFVTGDYVVGGAALRGLGTPNSSTQAITGGVSSYASAVVHMSGVPGYVANGVSQRADIVAAYLYWETVADPTADPALLAKGTFRGLKIVGTQIAAAGTMACWSSGGGNGNQSGAQRLLVYRADVLRYLPYAKDPITGEPLGQRLVNDTDLIANNLPLHTVSLPDSGAGGSQSPSTGNQAFLSEGTSLVVVYRIGGGAQLKSVVLYDGGYTFSSINPQMAQTIRGFYQSSTSKTDLHAKMTHIVGDGDKNFRDVLTVNSSAVPGVSDTNAFQGALGFAWDNLTFDVSSLMAGGDQAITTNVSPGGSNSVDCLSWSAIVFSTSVQDTDGDGLLDTWESNGFTDISDGSFINLPAMGANPNVKDLFIELDYMKTAGYTNATQGTVPAHSHLPTIAALQSVAAAFSGRINVHFDVGNNYQPSSAATPLTPRPDYIIQANLGAKGGEAIDETSCGATQSLTCLYPDFPGTLSWKTGFGVVKSAHFDHSRKDIFHYALFAHTLGLPRWRIYDQSLTNIVVSGGIATLTTQIPHELTGSIKISVVGAPDSSSPATSLNGTYTATIGSSNTLTFSTAAASGTYRNWGLAVSDGSPRSNSGVSDVGGGDLMVTLGRWDDFTATPFIQASTLFHEIGHNLDLGHGGDISDPTNCKPNYQSSMSYLFQVRGLMDASGVPHINYSNVALPTLNESKLSESPGSLGTTALPYLPRWYVPLDSSFIDKFINTTAATKHCDGTPITDGKQLVRVDGTSLIPNPLDWNGDGSTDAVLPQDINFDGAVASASVTGFQGFDDWANINLQQVGARRNGFATSVDVGPGQDTGDDLGIASGGLGIASGGLGIATGDGDFGIASGGLGIASGGLGIASGGLGIASGGLGIASGGLGADVDLESAKSLGNSPNGLTAAVVRTNIDLAWSTPNVGKVSQYQVWRVTCPRNSTAATCVLSPSNTPVQIGTSTPASPLCDTSFNFCDGTVRRNTLYIYFVTATIEAKRSGASNLVKQSF